MHGSFGTLARESEVMELLEGPDLFDFLANRSARLEEVTARGLVRRGVGAAGGLTVSPEATIGRAVDGWAVGDWCWVVGSGGCWGGVGWVVGGWWWSLREV